MRHRALKKKYDAPEKQVGAFFHPYLAATRLTEAKGRRAASEHCQPFASAGMMFQHEPKPKEKRLTMFMRRLLAKDHFNTNTASTINTSPISASQLAAI